MKLYAEILLPLPFSQKFLYEVPSDWSGKAEIGSRVLVSFHNRTLTGFIVRLKRRRPATPMDIKEIIEVLDDKPIFSSSFLSFVKRLSDAYFSSFGELLQAALPSGYILKSKRDVIVTECGKEALEGDDLSAEERKLLNLYMKRPYSEPYVKRKTGLENIPTLLLRLEKKGFVRIEKTVRKSAQKAWIPSDRGPTQLEMDFSLDEELYLSSLKISSFVGQNVFSTFFLFGPSNKREPIYFDLIKKNMEYRKSTLFLVPEISLTEAFKNKIKRRFGERAALIHSQMTKRQRVLEWQRIKAGDTHIVVGPRSAVFAPLENLGLIIVDEEHDDSYYQKESPSYDARGGGWIRAQQESALLVYGSSMPSVERYFYARQQKHLVVLSKEEHPYHVRIIESRVGEWSINSMIRRRIEETIKQNNQALIFYNRRGYAPFLICSDCSSIPRCRRCDKGLTYHKKEQKMICHYCGYTVAKFDFCGECGRKLTFGKSMGIEAVEEELHRFLPRAKIFSFNLDVVKNKKEQKKAIERFSAGEIDILLGTQLLLHQRDIPPVSLAISLFPETTLSLFDLSANSKTFQNLSQMTFFLKKEKGSELFIQTSRFPHFSVRSAAENDYHSFYEREIKYRRMMGYPPFSSMVEIVFYGKNLRVLGNNSRKFLSLVKDLSGNIEVLGPAFAPVSKVRGINRVQVILKSKRRRELNKTLRQVLPQRKIRKSIYVFENLG